MPVEARLLQTAQGQQGRGEPCMGEGPGAVPVRGPGGDRGCEGVYGAGRLPERVQCQTPLEVESGAGVGTERPGRARRLLVPRLGRGEVEEGLTPLPGVGTGYGSLTQQEGERRGVGGGTRRGDRGVGELPCLLVESQVQRLDAHRAQSDRVETPVVRLPGEAEGDGEVALGESGVSGVHGHPGQLMGELAGGGEQFPALGGAGQRRQETTGVVGEVGDQGRARVRSPVALHEIREEPGHLPERPDLLSSRTGARAPGHGTVGAPGFPGGYGVDSRIVRRLAQPHTASGVDIGAAQRRQLVGRVARCGPDGRRRPSGLPPGAGEAGVLRGDHPSDTAAESRSDQVRDRRLGPGPRQPPGDRGPAVTQGQALQPAALVDRQHQFSGVPVGFVHQGREATIGLFACHGPHSHESASSCGRADPDTDEGAEHGARPGAGHGVSEIGRAHV